MTVGFFSERGLGSATLLLCVYALFSVGKAAHCIDLFISAWKLLL